MSNFSYTIFIALFVLACRQSNPGAENEHSHEDGSASLSHTVYSEKTELFVEYKPLVVGQSARFAAHFTKLGETFAPLEEGAITLSLIVNEKGLRQTNDQPSSPGIFRLALKPTVAGKGKLIFDIKTKEYTDRIVIDPVTVFPDEETARQASAEKMADGGIAFLKEQAWTIEFATKKIQPEPFNEVIQVSGKLKPRPSDEQIVAARSNGVVTWSDAFLPGSAVRQGQQLFILSSGNVTEGNSQSQYLEARANFQKAEADYNRVQPLVAEKVISEKNFLEVKNQYERAKIRFETLSKNYSRGGQAIPSPMNGFVKEITVRSGEYVNTGQALAIITRDQSLQLEAEVPLRYAASLPLITEAHFKTLHNTKVYSTRELDGKVLAYGKAVSGTASLLPILFSLTNNGELIAGEPVEVYLQSRAIPNALVLPVDALI